MVVNSETVLILGAAGFLGTALSHFCVKQGMQTIGVDIVAPDNTVPFFAFYQTARLELEIGGLLKKFQPAYLIHLAGNADVGKSIVNPYNDFQGSVVLFSAVLDQVRQFSGATKVLFASSAAVYGQPKKLPIDENASLQPISPYGYHKWMCELVAKEYSSIYGVQTASARIFSAYGSGLRKQIFWDLCRKCSCSGTIELAGDGSESRDFIHAEDIANASLCILRGGDFAGECYNVARGDEVTISELAHRVLDSYGISRDRLVFSNTGRAGDPKNWRADIGLLQALGFMPSVAFSQGVSEYVQWFKQL